MNQKYQVITCFVAFCSLSIGFGLGFITAYYKESNTEIPKLPSLLDQFGDPICPQNKNSRPLIFTPKLII